MAEFNRKPDGANEPLLLEQGLNNGTNELALMTLNLQYFASYPKDEEAARKRLLEVTKGCDIICVQEGLKTKDVLSELGFRRWVCAGQEGVAQSVKEMVYGDEPTLRSCDESLHSQLLCNQIYTREDSSWKVQDSGTIQISSDLQLVGGGGRAQGKLAIRSMVWVKVRWKGLSGPSAYVMCTHFSGGRFEDQYFVQQLADERFDQATRVLSFFENRPNPLADDVGILLGDFNATTEYTVCGPMHGYFKAGIVNSAGVQADASAAALGEEQLAEHFKKYMTSPFTAIEKKGWKFAYTQEQVGVTSGFGHLIDHMAMSRPVKIKSAQVIHLTNQKFGNKPKDTDLPLTDHNSVKTIFCISATQKDAALSRRIVFGKRFNRRAVVFGILLLGAAMLGYFALGKEVAARF
eukprot:TRINITY_DN2428_c0_g1_i2.p1 TRINITY_DN2428_c0_g1~~TRINITY_DN2428_c0_g1_i2.p1  ORF type:complete len:406 (-),score=64.98 TRINITY_DN2428_c0_g1_i2:111-1328(-)